MTEYANNTPVGVTHIWPYNRLINPDAQPFSSEREADVWDELRDLTFDKDAHGDIWVTTHVAVHHEQVKKEFANALLKDDVVYNRVSF